MVNKLIAIVLFGFWLAAALNGDALAVIGLTLAIVLVETI